MRRMERISHLTGNVEWGHGRLIDRADVLALLAKHEVDSEV